MRIYTSACNVHFGRETFDRLLQKYTENCNYIGVLSAILNNFHPSLWGERALKLVSVIEKSQSSKMWATSVDAYVALGRGMITQPPEKEKHRLQILNKAWKVIKNVQDIKKYTSACCVYVELLVRHYSEKEVLILLKDIAKRISRDIAKEEITTGAQDEVLSDLEAIAQNIVVEADEFGAVLTSAHFLTIMDMFTPDKKMRLCKQLLVSFASSKHTTSDAVIIHTVFDLARNLHDNIDSLSFDDERRQIAKLISDFIQKVDFGRDLEHQLNVYVDCRAAFPNLDLVTERLVLATAQLVMRTYSIVKGRHSRKTGSFVKACLAFCHVTIPSIEKVFKRIRLFILCGQVALQNQCIPQADTMFKEVIALLPTVPATLTEDRKKRSTEPRLRDVVGTLLSCLVVVPGHPDPTKGPFYLIKQLLQAIKHVNWQNPAAHAEMFIEAVGVLAAYDQRSLPYRVKFVQANDELYAGATKYKRDLLKHLETVIKEVTTYINESAAPHPGATHQIIPEPTATLALQLFDTVCHHEYDLGDFFSLKTVLKFKYLNVDSFISCFK